MRTNEPQDEDGGAADVARRLLVRDAIEEPMRPVCVVSGDQSVADVAECFADNPGVSTSPVVDERGRLLGIIPMRLLLDDLYLLIAPEEFLADLDEEGRLEEFGRISRAKTASALMEPPAYVTADDSARDAFALMHERQLEGLPIVDAEIKVVGYLDRLHLVRLWLRYYQSE